MPLGVDTRTHIPMHERKQFQETRQSPATGWHTSGLETDQSANCICIDVTTYIKHVL